jgi:hypothetical protein
MLKQQSLYQFVLPTKGRWHEQGRSKSKADFDFPKHSLPWGDSLNAKRTANGELFRTYGHNPNGLSCRDNNLDLKQFATAIHAKDVAILSIYEVNCNFEKTEVLKNFHHHLSGISSHHKGAVSSVKLNLDSAYQPGGTAVSVRNKWAFSGF